jgi:hypothetical protein
MATGPKSIILMPPDPERPTPRRLYKYLAFKSDASKEQVRSILVGRTLYFSSRTKFNDPFDCFIPSFVDVPKADMLRFLANRFLRNKVAKNKSEAHDLARMIDLGRLQTDLQNDVNKIGILCLTEDPTNMLMWGHYADCHSGLCLQFAASEMDTFFGPAQPIVYSRDRPRFDPNGTEADNAGTALLTKSIDWVYELEWRVINYATGSRSYVFPSGNLVGIILGYQMPLEERQQVLEMVANGGFSAVAVYEALPDEHEYKMHLRLFR